MQADADIGRVLRPPTFDLKWSVMWNVVAVGLLCFLGAGTISVYEVAEQAWRTNRSIGDAVGKQHLEAQLLLPQFPTYETRGDNGSEASSANVQKFLGDAVARATCVMKPGQCVQYVSSVGQNFVSHCLGFHNQEKEAPELPPQEGASLADRTRSPLRSSKPSTL